MTELRARAGTERPSDFTPLSQLSLLFHLVHLEHSLHYIVHLFWSSVLPSHHHIHSTDDATLSPFTLPYLPTSALIPTFLSVFTLLPESVFYFLR